MIRNGSTRYVSVYTKLHVRYDWSEADTKMYQSCFSSLLNSNVNIPHCVLGCSMYCTDVSHFSDIDKYYADVSRQLQISVCQLWSRNLIATMCLGGLILLKINIIYM